MEIKGNKGNKQRDSLGRYVKGVYEGGPGRSIETPEQKVIRKATKEFIADYKAKLAAALPKISPVLISQATKGNIQAIKEINDRVMGKAPQDITSGGEPIGDKIINIYTDEQRARIIRRGFNRLTGSEKSPD